MALARMKSRLRRAMLSTLMPFGQAASHSYWFVQLPKPSASICFIMARTRLERSGWPCGSRLRWAILAEVNSMAEAFLQEATQAPQPMQAAASKAASAFMDVLTMEEQTVDEEELWKGLRTVLEGAFEQFVAARATEGEHLKKDILAKLSGMEVLIAGIEEHSPEIAAQYRAKLEEKVRELLGDVQMEESRIAAEVILFADKICTDEEVVRLKSHISHMRDTLDESEGIGRKLDFIAQEMNREANTILSKANDQEISNYAISLKTEIEKIREQIQNIE